jgi:hypothetical protein
MTADAAPTEHPARLGSRIGARHGSPMHLQERLDPRGAFRNQWLQSHVLGNA